MYISVMLWAKPDYFIGIIVIDVMGMGFGSATKKANFLIQCSL
jgi:hypothetical protein